MVAAALVVAAVVGADAARDPTRSSRPRELDKTYDADFDYFVYTMTWPGTFCEEKHCTKEPRYFTVHGLWPNYENGKWPAFCNSSYPFDENEIEDLLPVMNEVRFQFSTQRPHQRLEPLPFFPGNLTGTKLSSQRWPDVLSSHEGDWLWSHEWDKHGTCAKPVLNGEHEYFAKALELYDILNPTEVFAQNGMIPSNTRTYDRDQVISVLTKSFGDTFVIGCQESGKDLFQIEFCLQKDFQGRNCGKSANSNCSSRIRIPN